MFISSRPPLHRMMTIDQELRKGTWPNAVSLAKSLEVDSRTIHRDIEFMRDQLKAPIQFVPERKGYHYSSAIYTLPYLQTTEGELLALLLGANLLKQYQGTPFEHDLTSAFEKLKSNMPDHVTISLSSLSEALTVAATPRVQIDPVVYANTLKALRERHTLQIDYWSASSNRQTSRLIDPYHLVMGEDCFLVARCHTRKEILMFSMHRIRACTLTDETFNLPAKFELSQYLGKSFRSVRGKETHTVVLHFTSELAGRIEERTWHSTQSTKRLPTGGLELRIEVTALVEVMRWVLSWGKDCKVIKPAKLSSLVEKELQSAIKLY